ncbi:MAG TPA: serine hydrolase [Pyrinomonadaceae bacterium]|nr:serine hydrolase [Pyrinomonadaceae bacterium]
MNKIAIRQTSALMRSLIVCAMILGALQGQGFAQSQSPKAAKIDEVMTTANKYRLFNGSVLVAENGKVIYKKGLGLANMEWNIPNTPETRFRLGSITKQFTAALILQLVDQGKVKVDGKLSDYLPTYRKDVGEKVTVHQLLNHTSGIPSYTGLPSFMKDVSRNPFTVDEFVTKYASNDLQFEPGSKFSYNNSGYFLLGAIIEKVTGKPYATVLKEQILDPLGMKNTGYDLAGTIVEKRAAGYQKTADGYVNASYLDMSIPYAAGSLYSTVEDLYLWDQALYTDRVVSPGSKALMYKPNLSDYAYGWTITKTNFSGGTANVPIIAHGGGINGFNTVIARFPEQKHLVVLLDNTSQGGSLGGIQREIVNILYGQPHELPRMPLAEVLNKTIGEKGIEAAVAQYREFKTKQPKVYDFREPELNRLGYQLMGQKKLKEAIEIFKLNVAEYPQGFNTYDSLAEAYMNNGDTELAIQNYKKSLELNPQNASATATLKRLESKPEEKVAVTISYDAYVGEYEVSPTFKAAVFKEGDKLMTQATGQPVFELFPEGEDKFFLKVVDAKVTFTRDDKGLVTGLVIHQGGRDIPGKKTK